MKVNEQGLLTEKQAFSPKGCCAGTANACFALIMGHKGMQCGLISNQNVNQMTGITLGWRVNVDESDGKAWYPLGVLGNSKKDIYKIKKEEVSK